MSPLSIGGAGGGGGGGTLPIIYSLGEEFTTVTNAAQAAADILQVASSLNLGIGDRIWLWDFLSRRRNTHSFHEITSTPNGQMRYGITPDLPRAVSVGTYVIPIAMGGSTIAAVEDDGAYRTFQLPDNDYSHLHFEFDLWFEGGGTGRSATGIDGSHIEVELYPSNGIMKRIVDGTFDIITDNDPTKVDWPIHTDTYKGSSVMATITISYEVDTRQLVFTVGDRSTQSSGAITSYTSFLIPDILVKGS